MRQHKQERSKCIGKAVSMMLILLLGFVFAAPLIHTHYNEESVEHAEKEIRSEIKKCPICTFLTHHQQEKYLISVHQALTAPVQTFKAKLSEIVVNTYVFTLQGLNNKGPPLSQKLDISLV